mgnify:CR=1 FL=1|tara:strand:- start:1618 stop:2862 length:1245 start_codon:yes stop_codon:yes gene_type:complete
MNLLLSLLLVSFCFNSQQIFVACEGNFYEGNGSIWTISDEEAFSYNNNPLGEVVQSVYVHGNQLYVIVNGSSNIQVFDIENNSLIPTHFIDTQYSGPREMMVIDNYLYFTNWYTADIKKLSLDTWEIVNEISTPGLPEDIKFHNGFIYVSITMNLDWTDGNSIIIIDPLTDEITNNIEVGLGPGEILIHEDEVYVARTYYDDEWNAFYGTSKIDSNNEVIIASYGAGAACGGGIYSHNGDIYRVYNGGIAKINQELEIIPESRIGEYESWEVYSAEIIGDNIYFGLTDFSAPDDVAVVDFNGNEIARYSVGAIPGDFAVFESCINNGDMNEDGDINIADIVSIVQLILNESEYNCTADINDDGLTNILDAVQLVQEVLGIDSFRGAANWLKHYFPELNVNEQIIKAFKNIKVSD